MTKERPPKKEALRIGHRGACGHAPENTLRSIAQAVALGCDLIEVDVQRTKDGHLGLADPEARIIVLLNRPPKDPTAEAARLQATHVGLRFDTATKPLVTTLHKARLTVFVYTVNKPKDIQRMRALGVDGIISDYPDRI